MDPTHDDDKNRAYSDGTWRVCFPVGWQVRRDEACATFEAVPPVGALQISSAEKAGGEVTIEDLTEFAVDRVPPGVRLNNAEIGLFSGITVDYERDGTFWQEWWLKSGDTLVYATYNVSAHDKAAEYDAVMAILKSLTR
jgi:hypothetical protein